MITKSTLLIFFILAAALVLGVAEGQGPENIDINTVGKGLVPFPHRDHQDRLVDCGICHQLFPMEKDATSKLKSEGQLKKKQVMKELCIQCHEDTDKSGKDSGPVRCSQCHTKE